MLTDELSGMRQMYLKAPYCSNKILRDMVRVRNTSFSPGVSEKAITGTTAIKNTLCKSEEQHKSYFMYPLMKEEASTSVRMMGRH